ncbi:MAG: 16S rRNA processing protein RimM [Bdellovibrio sp.]|nr:16S rRNA processing protein RimM [Bdellovibrio sp.]
MEKNQFTHIGKVYDAHGIRGDLVILVFSGDNSWVDTLENLNLVHNGQTKSFKVLKTRPHKKGFVCQLEGFDNRNIAEDFIGSEVWVDADLFISDDGESLFLKEILNFEIIDAKEGSIGLIESFSFNGMQDLLVIKKAGAKAPIEIPFIKEFVTKLDNINKKIYMELPEGLISINEPEEKSEKE